MGKFEIEQKSRTEFLAKKCILEQCTVSCQARPQWGHNFGKKYWSAAASESKRGLVSPYFTNGSV